VSEERRKPFAVDQEKFATQRAISYLLILIFAAVVSEVLWRNVETERSTVLQTVINLTMLAVGYWLGASKQGHDQAHSMSRIAEAAPGVAAAVVAAQDSKPLKTEDVKMEVAGDVTVNQEKLK
jgi:predicted Na+-dependent transporter